MPSNTTVPKREEMVIKEQKTKCDTATVNFNKAVKTVLETVAKLRLKNKKFSPLTK